MVDKLRVLDTATPPPSVVMFILSVSPERVYLQQGNETENDAGSNHHCVLINVIHTRGMCVNLKQFVVRPVSTREGIVAIEISAHPTARQRSRERSSRTAHQKSKISEDGAVGV